MCQYVIPLFIIFYFATNSFYHEAHGCKNFKKQLEKLGHKHPDIAKVAKRCGAAMRSIITKSNGNVEIFKAEVDRKMNHYCGCHDFCQGECFKNKNQVLNANDQEAFKVKKENNLFDNLQKCWMDFAETYEKYQFGESTNSVEAVNSIRRKFADKKNDFSII